MSFFALCLTVLSAVSSFPGELRRSAPVADINQAIVYTVNEPILTDQDLAVARSVGSDMLIRGWFKWHNSIDYTPLTPLVPKAHAAGALFGGGITCSALYDRENKLTDAEVLDMATRDSAGNLVDAWKTPGCRHGTLSNPRYIDYLFRWCREQIDAGADYLFMDEHTAVLHENEGFDDYSNRDFRDFLIRTRSPQGWTATDPRWAEQFKIDLADKAIAPDGTIATFDYRAWLKKNEHVAGPHSPKNPLSPTWHLFRRERDDRAWKQLTDRIRQYAAGKNRRVLISANGLAKYVDLQVLGVWGLWAVTPEGAVDFSQPQIRDWAALARAGNSLASRKVPTVLFHDWGFGGFPWLKVTSAERTLWNRIRGAEIYAAGAFYAFPVHGPFGCDAEKDGILPDIIHQTAFYQRNKSLYLGATFRSIDSVKLADPLISASLWTRAKSPALLVHVINRQVTDKTLQRRRNVTVELPTVVLPTSVRVVSPDWNGSRMATAKRTASGVQVTLPELDAYAIAILDYSSPPPLKIAGDRIVPSKRWERPEVSEFKIDSNGQVDQPTALDGVLQGKLHTDMANPPTFLVNAAGPATAALQVQAVATVGARIECLVDGRLVAAVDLPDLDRKNDTLATEYDKVIEVPIPPGRHRISIRNTGPDWASIAWFRFSGSLGD